MLDPPLQLINGQGWATYPVPVTKEPGFETWVTDVVIDGRGFLWVGTNRGLYLRICLIPPGTGRPCSIILQMTSMSIVSAGSGSQPKSRST